MLIEIHMLKNYPPVNLNRDESGMPKTCFFGGVQRGRISSQCLKRSWRTSEIFKNLGSYGIRTRRMPDLAAEKLETMGVPDEYIGEAKKLLTGIANKDGKMSQDGKTAQMIFYAEDEIDRIASEVKKMIEKDASLEKFKKRKPKEMKELLEAVKISPVTADIALFGRMVTSEYFADVDAAMQVAHAISTHAVNRESDFFTAVDDLLQERDESGAGMMGDVDYNSCCYYEYASLDTDALCDNLKNVEGSQELVQKLIPVLLKAMAYSNPSGKQNTFAGQIVPGFVMAECKKDKIPLSYVNAFELPVSCWGENPRIVDNSIKKLLQHVECMDRAYELPIEHRIYFAPEFKDRQDGKNGQWVDKYSELMDLCAGWLKE